MIYCDSMERGDADPIAEKRRQAMMVLCNRVMELRDRLNITPMRVSKATADLIDYCARHQADDPLIIAFKDNPFKEKRSCTIL